MEILFMNPWSMEFLDLIFEITPNVDDAREKNSLEKELVKKPLMNALQGFKNVGACSALTEIVTI